VIEASEKSEKGTMFVTKSGKIIDEDWREDVELCGFWFIQSPSMIL